jgi:hypothetical protein
LIQRNSTTEDRRTPKGRRGEREKIEIKMGEKREEA